MKRVVRNRLRVRDFEGLARFYGDLLGMTQFGAGHGDEIFGYDDTQCCLEFIPTATERYSPNPDDFYWKIGITLRNLDAAVGYLRTRGLAVPDPYQFRDIGYMTKIADPNGLIIELLQQGFEGHEEPVPDGHPIGAQAALAHITLRVSDITSAADYFETALDMRLMSVQPVGERGFCLYFYAWSTESLPDPDLKSVANREWLWHRPYALIELQHLETSGASVRKAEAQTCGFDGFSYANEGDDRPITVSVSDLRHLS